MSPEAKSDTLLWKNDYCGAAKMAGLEDRTNEYIKQLFANQPYVMSEEDKRLGNNDLAGFLAAKLLRKKFRKQKLHQDTIDEFGSKIAARVRDKKPLHFTIPFGGYKHFSNPSHPLPDWAEIFSFKFLAEWLAPVAGAYEPGAIVEFISEDLILTRMDNYPEKALEEYSNAFASLLESCKIFLPRNIKFDFFRVSDRCDKKSLVADVEKLLPERWHGWEKLSDEEKEIELKRSHRSVMWQGQEDWTKLSPEEKEKKTIESRLIELAYYDIEADPKYLGNYFTEDNRIGICFSFGLSPDNTTHWISLGSTYASVVDFWIGRGILETDDEKFVRRIVSKQQYDKIKDKLINCKIELGFLPSNLQNIELIEPEDWRLA